MTDKEAMAMALEALETLMLERGSIYEQAIAALKARLAQPEQEPVAFASHGVINWIADKQFQHEADLYTTPPQRTEPPQKKKVWTFWDLSGGDIADAIKAKIKEKNQ